MGYIITGIVLSFLLIGCTKYLMPSTTKIIIFNTLEDEVSNVRINDIIVTEDIAPGESVSIDLSEAECSDIVFSYSCFVTSYQGDLEIRSLKTFVSEVNIAINETNKFYIEQE